MHLPHPPVRAPAAPPRVTHLEEPKAPALELVPETAVRTNRNIITCHQNATHVLQHNKKSTTCRRNTMFQCHFPSEEHSQLLKTLKQAGPAGGELGLLCFTDEKTVLCSKLASSFLLLGVNAKAHWSHLCPGPALSDAISSHHSLAAQAKWASHRAPHSPGAFSPPGLSSCSLFFLEPAISTSLLHRSPLKGLPQRGLPWPFGKRARASVFVLSPAALVLLALMPPDMSCIHVFITLFFFFLSPSSSK